MTAIAAHAERHALDRAACHRLVRRCEVLLAALQYGREAADAAWSAHGVDRVRRFCGQDLELARAADEEQLSRSYSPRRWGFWDQYGGPATVLGTVEVQEGALRPGRHACPDAVRELFAPLLSLAGQETVSFPDLAQAGQAALGVPSPAGQEWLTEVLTATDAGGVHAPQGWEASDRTRRATFRILGRAIALHGHEGKGYQETLRSAVAFGEEMSTDPVLAAVPETAGWRGLLLPAEHQLRAQGGDAPMTDVLLLLVGALRSREGHLPGDVRAVFLGRQRHSAEFLDPTWVDGLINDFSDRPVRDMAARLVDDMLAQSRRVALGKLRTDPATGGLKIFSRLHLRNERYFRTGDEGDSDIGTRIPQLGSFGEQLGIFAVRSGCHTVTEHGRRVLETEL